jgi:hypothetical protein
MRQRGTLYARVWTTSHQREQVASRIEAIAQAASNGRDDASEAQHPCSRLDRPRLDALRDAAVDGRLDPVSACTGSIDSCATKTISVADWEFGTVEVRFIGSTIA